jgi:hypothetical protein
MDESFFQRYEEEERERLKTAEGRYYHRLRDFLSDGKPYPRARHHAQWLLHNVVVHPLVGVFPGSVTTKLHDLSSAWLNKGAGRASTPPVVRNHLRREWLYHNVVAHILIGLVPCEETFKLHDRTAKEMRVPGWV